jgi:lipid-A-disaccharide synthase-like uncharacterized protein
MFAHMPQYGTFGWVCTLPYLALTVYFFLMAIIGVLARIVFKERWFIEWLKMPEGVPAVSWHVWWVTTLATIVVTGLILAVSTIASSGIAFAPLFFYVGSAITILIAFFLVLIWVVDP